MRVALVASDIPEHALEFAKMMASACEILLCIPNKYELSSDVRGYNRLTIDPMDWPRQRDPRNIIFSQRLARRIKRWRPDLVHFQNEGSVWNWFVAAFLKGIPKVTTVHDVVPHPGDTSSRRVPRLFANALIRRSDAIIVHGDKLRSVATGMLPINPDRIFSVPLVPPSRPSNPPIREKDVNLFRMLFYGRIYEYKGLHYLLKAMPIIHDKVPNVHLIVAGRGEDISRYKPFTTDYSYIEFQNRFLTAENLSNYLHGLTCLPCLTLRPHKVDR